MARVWMLADPCADPRMFARGSRPDWLPVNSSDNVFFSFLYSTLTVLQFTVAYQWFISKKTISLQGFGGGGGGWGVGGGCGSTFSRRVQPFSRGVKLFPGRGPNANFGNPQNLWFSRRGCGPSFPSLWIPTCDHLTTRNWLKRLYR